MAQAASLEGKVTGIVVFIGVVGVVCIRGMHMRRINAAGRLGMHRKRRMCVVGKLLRHGDRYCSLYRRSMCRRRTFDSFDEFLLPRVV